MTRIPFLAASYVLVSGFLAEAAFSQEYSISSHSTVIGRNYGIATGTTARPDGGTGSDGRTPVGQLDLVAESVFFIKNLEITGFPESRGIDGETFIGFLAPLRLRYRAAREVTVEGGAVIGHNFGDDDGPDIAEPLARLVYEPMENLFIVGGTLLRTHWIKDALLDDAHAFRMNAEQGFQFRADTTHWKNDSWINWRIREEETRAEEFEVGNSTQFRWWGLRGDGQMLWSHVGGQKNTADRVRDNIAIAFGGSIGLEGTGVIEPGSMLKDARLEGTYYFSRDDDRTESGGKRDGRGYELCISADVRVRDNWLVRGHASVFRGDGFSPDRGDILYTLDAYAQVGAASLWELPGGMCAEASIVAQQTEDNLNYTFGIYLTWGKAFRLWKQEAGD